MSLMSILLNRGYLYRNNKQMGKHSDSGNDFNELWVFFSPKAAKKIKGDGLSYSRLFYDKSRICEFKEASESFLVSAG